MTTTSTALPVDTFNLFPAAPQNHVFHLARLPQLSFVVQEVNLPGIMATPARMMVPGLAVRHAADRLTYDPLTVTFLVDEEFRAHRELHRWLVGITGGEDRTTLVQQFINDQATYLWPETTDQHTYGRATSTTAGLTIVNGAKIPILRVMFHNVHLTQIGSVQFSTTTPDTITPLTSTATFEYDFFSIVDVFR